MSYCRRWPPFVTLSEEVIASSLRHGVAFSFKKQNTKKIIIIIRRKSKSACGRATEHGVCDAVKSREEDDVVDVFVLYLYFGSGVA